MNFEAIITKINRVREMQDMIERISDEYRAGYFALGEVKLNPSVLGPAALEALYDAINKTKLELEALGVTFNEEA